MKLLIADDEILTRDGLVQSIDWNTLGISQILTADDGINGIAVAKKTPPDIILTDVRMPRMNGIEMARQIQLINPDCPIIFMSGYSDKEYLKAAISLRAVRYVEKPIDAQEIMEAVREAAYFVMERRRQFQNHELFQKEASSRLALCLTKPGFLPEAFIELPASQEGLFHQSTWFVTLIVRFRQELSDLVESDLSQLLKQMETLISRRHLHDIYTLKQEEFLIFHIYGNQRFSPELLKSLSLEIRMLLQEYSHFYLAVGKSVMGAKKVFQSYQSAVILLQNAFFYPYGSILYPCQEDEARMTSNQDYGLLCQEFLTHLANQDMEEAVSLAKRLYQLLSYNHTLLPNQAKDIYYKLLSNITSALYQLKLSASPQNQTPPSPMELVAQCSNLNELNELLTSQLSAFQELLDHAQPENSTVFLIRDYIGKHFDNDCLSIKDISEHVHLSTSYICTIFKSETGKTLNQYITEFRIEKAKQLLADPRNRISEISAKVGYADGNYFSKSFKKAVGLSPSEYRERELS